MSKTIMRVEKNKENPYLMLNKTSLNDKKLSWKAKGLHAYLMSLPDDWKIYIEELMTHAKDARDSTRTAVNELIDAGYIKRTDIKDERGRFCGKEYIVYETPLEKDASPENGKPVNGNANIGKPPATNKELKLSNNIKLNNQSVSQEPTDELTETIKLYTPELQIFLFRVISTMLESHRKLLRREIIDDALLKYREQLERKRITNHEEYFVKCLITSIEEYGLRDFE